MGIIPWICIFTYLAATDTSKIPNFVWGVLFAYIICFNTFPLNMFFQYYQVGNWNDSLYNGENNGGFFN